MQSPAKFMLALVFGLILAIGLLSFAHSAECPSDSPAFASLKLDQDPKVEKIYTLSDEIVDMIRTRMKATGANFGGGDATIAIKFVTLKSQPVGLIAELDANTCVIYVEQVSSEQFLNWLAAQRPNEANK